MAFTPIALTPLKLSGGSRQASAAAPAESTATLVSTPLPNLERLAASAPTPLSLDDLATRVGCEPLLLERVSQRRQGLPRELVGPIATALGLRWGDVSAAVGSVLVLGPRLDARVEGAFRPIPPDRALGDPLFMRPIAPTAAVAFG